MKQDIHHQECKECKLEKPKIRFDKFPSKDPKWVDDSGKLWNGITCPDCHRAIKKKKAKSRRKLKKNENNGTEVSSDPVVF